MKLRVLGAVLAAGVLGGCTNADWDHATSYVGLGNSDQPTAQPRQAEAAPAAPTPAADGWCDEVAKAAQTDAAEQGFDIPTQQHRAQAAFQQCNASPSKALN